MPPAAAERTHTAPIDGATTFDSPFLARTGCFGSWESPYCPPMVRAGAFDGISGLCLSLFCRRASRSRRFPVGFSSRDFLHTKICVRVKLPPTAYAPGFGLNRRPLGRRSLPVALPRRNCKAAGALCWRGCSLFPPFFGRTRRRGGAEKPPPQKKEKNRPRERTYVIQEAQKDRLPGFLGRRDGARLCCGKRQRRAGAFGRASAYRARIRGGMVDV